jgi:hypothetical protein
LDFDVLFRSNALHIFVIPVKIHHVFGTIGVQIPHPMYKLEATAFHNYGITKLFFPSKTLQSFKAIFFQSTKDKVNSFALELIH